jgi:hypothetical protein
MFGKRQEPWFLFATQGNVVQTLDLNGNCRCGLAVS